MRSGATKQSHDLSNDYGIASSAFGLLSMTNGAYFKALLVSKNMSNINPSRVPVLGEVGEPGGGGRHQELPLPAVEQLV